MNRPPEPSALWLADEIHRAPPKVQSALLEAMAEHQVTEGGQARRLPELFIVLATQNPLEQSGTYPLPEAQCQWRTWRRRRARRALVAAVLCPLPTPTPCALRRLLLAPTRCHTLAEWAAHRGGEQAASVAARLNAACFGRSGGDLEAVKCEIAGLLRRGQSGPERYARGRRRLA